MAAVDSVSIPTDLPPVPLTVEGASVLHQMLRVRWAAWRALGASERAAILEEAAEAVGAWGGNRSAAFSLLGHKGDLMLVHFRNSFDELAEVQTGLPALRLWDYLEPSSSYLSVVELGLYESTGKVYASLAERGAAPHSAEWNAEIESTLERQRQAMRPRLFPDIPPAKYICFYPMDRRRGEEQNWYQAPMEERRRMMEEHGAVGRRYAGQVKQIITGSIGLDDWEWGVTLFADDPLIFKKLIYEMRFDKVSAVYALFGAFYVGKRMNGEQFRKFLSFNR
ncbi:MAG TPA: hydrogen peroxide-dependent heme synthase [Bryobacteraceae bacterium]|nr:hydrogen peroxide-dependent heme synthase [Bryobacteraceae bacterium]